MKIAFLHYTVGLINRGSEISTKILADYLAKRGHQIYLYHLGEVKEKTNYCSIQIRLAVKPHLSKNTFVLGKVLERLYLDYNSLVVGLFSIKALVKLIKDKPDIIIPTNGFWQIIICKIAKIFIHSKIVVIGRAGVGWTDKDNLRLKPDLFIGLTPQAVDWAKTVVGQGKSIYLPNPIDITSFLANKEQAKIHLKKPIILTVAALTAYKHIDKLIEACGQLKGVSLLVVGEGELYSTLNRIGKEKLDTRFTIATFKQSQMPSVYKACQLFVLLSDEREAFGRVFLEAMACGLPIVTMNTAARRDIMGSSGIFVDNLDTVTLATALRRGLRKKVGEIEMKQVKLFDIKTVGLRYENEFLALVKDK